MHIFSIGYEKLINQNVLQEQYHPLAACNILQALLVGYILWQHRLWSFQTEGLKLERVLPRNQHTHRKFLDFENWTNEEHQ